MGLAITVPFIGETEPVSRSRMMLWVVVIIIITLAIIGVYAI
jgi:hypothetical protein